MERAIKTEIDIRTECKGVEMLGWFMSDINRKPVRDTSWINARKAIEG